MAFKLVEQKWCEEQGCPIQSYIVDSADDIAALPSCCAGSTAEVAGGSTYIANASGEWVERGAGGSGGGGFVATMIVGGFDEANEEYIVESVDKTYEEIVEAASKGLVHEIKIDSSKDWGELKFFYAPLAKIDSNEVEFGRYYKGEETKVFIRADGTYEYLCIER